jgi:hypothetical protein
MASRFLVKCRAQWGGALVFVVVTSGCHYGGYLPTEPPLPTFAVRQLGLLIGGTQSEATGGSASVIVGWAADARGVAHAVSFAGGAATQLLEPWGALGSSAEAVNSAGVIVGSAIRSDGVREGVVWSAPRAAPTVLPSLGGTYSFATSINDQNTILGVAQNASGDTVLVVWQANGASYVVAPVDTTGGAGDLPAAINNSGQVAATLPDGGGAFFVDPGSGVDTIVAPNGTTVAEGLSNLGIEVGAIDDGPSPEQAFVFTGQIGIMVMGPPPAGYTNVIANSVSDLGIIAGTATTVSGGTTLLSEVVISSVVNPASAFAAVPTLGGKLAGAASNGVTSCGAILGWATASGSVAHVAVAWIPNGCVVP